jgi:hypothetical protein
MKALRTLTFGSRSYTIARLTDEQGHAIFGPELKVFSLGAQLVCASLNNADNGSRDESRIFKELALTEPELVELISACFAINGLRTKTSNDSVASPRLFLVGDRIFYVRSLSAVERERVRATVMIVRQSTGLDHAAQAHELVEIFAGAAGMTVSELYRTVEGVDLCRVVQVLYRVSGLPISSAGSIDFSSGMSSA